MRSCDCDGRSDNSEHLNDRSRKTKKVSPCITALIQSSAVRGCHNDTHDRNITWGIPPSQQKITLPVHVSRMYKILLETIEVGGTSTVTYWRGSDYSDLNIYLVFSFVLYVASVCM